jgi:CBS domain-containing protein
MTPRRISHALLHEPPELLHEHTPLNEAVKRLVDTDLPALPVVDGEERLKGIFGEREFLAALFPGYLKELKYAGFVKRGLDTALELRDACKQEPVGQHMNTEHVEVGPDFSDLELAEVFLHHRVLIIPVVDSGKVTGILQRHDFFRSLASHLAEAG